MEWSDVRAEGLQLVRPNTRLSGGAWQSTGPDEWGITSGGAVIYGDRQGLITYLKRAVRDLERVDEEESDYIEVGANEYDSQECTHCGDTVYTLSSRLWCDGCEEEADLARPAT